MPKFFLFDASGYIHRAYHALPPLTTSKGEPVNAVYGFTRMLSKVLRDDKPDYVAVCFDTAAPTFRHEQYVEYKATRSETDSALIAQLPVAYDVAKAWGLPCVGVDGFEADDVIATLARKGRAQGWDVVILSGDKDILQLVDEKIHVRDEMKKVEYDEAAVRERYGVNPKQVVDVLALMGDKVDNVIGVPGVGPKTASKLISDFGSIDGLYAGINGKPLPAKDKLIEFKANVYRNLELVRLREDVPIPFSAKEMTVQPADQETLAPLLKRLEFRGGLHGVDETVTDAVLETNKKRKIHTVLTELDLDLLRKELAGAHRLAYDLETDSPDQHTCDIVGVSLSVKADEAWYIPVGHRTIDSPKQLPWASVASLLKPYLENSRLQKCGQNVKFDNTILERNGIKVQKPIFDTMISAYCIDPSRPTYGLKDLAADYLGERMTRIEELIGKEGTFADVSVEQASAYAGADSEVTLRLMDLFAPRMKEEGVTELFETLEMPLVEVLQDMEAVGIQVDVDYLRKVGQKFTELGKVLEKEIHDLCGEPFVINSPKQLGRILFEKLKIPPIKKTKTGFSTDESVLTKLSADYPVCAKIIAWRELAKLISTYVEAIISMVNPKTGRVNGSFHQTGAATGRLSSTEPNLQNIPIRSDNGREIRKAFVAKPGCVFLSADYSQIDLRALAHMSQDPNLVKAFKAGGDIHTATAADVFHVKPEDVTEEMRRRAKAINFGIVYGQQAFGLSQSLGIPNKEAQEFINRYFERYAGVKTWIEGTLEAARKNGFVTTLAGRKRRLPDINSSNGAVRGFSERVAMNTPIQGTSADVIKAAMIKVFWSLKEMKAEARMLVQVHDELLFEVPVAEVEKVLPVIRRDMETAVELKVPLVVDVKKGPNWNDMEKIKRT